MDVFDDLTPTDFALLLDAVDSSSFDEHDDAVSDASDRSRKKEKPARDTYNDYRRRKREEREQLREQVEQLEKLLTKLQAEKATDPSAMISVIPSRVAMWRRMATQQRKARRTAEHENARLRKEFDKQRQLACQLKRLMQKQIKEETIGDRVSTCSTGLGTGHVMQAPRDWISSAAFERIESILAEAGLSDRMGDFEDVCVVSGVEGSGDYVQVRHARVFPFDMASVLRSTWQPTAVVPFVGQPHEAKVWTNDFFVVQYEMPAQIGRVEVTLAVELTVRRVVGPSRSVNAFTMAYTVQSEHVEYDGIQLLGEGVYSIQSLSHGEGSASSIVHCLERCKPQGARIDDLSLACGFVSEQYRAHFENVENALMDTTAVPLK